jgi:predicted CXXCH cytochrome family protein
LTTRYFTALLSIGITLGFSAGLLAQSDEIIIDNKGAYKRDQRPPVRFPHGLHMSGEIECLDCHHDYQKGKNVLDEGLLDEENMDKISCVACHGRQSKNKYALRDAFHLMCMGCHGKLDRKGARTGPRVCGKCHPWKESVSPANPAPSASGA